MPTITQLPVASGVSAADELPISQAGVTNSIRVDTLLAGTQPLLSVRTGGLLGRVSTGAGQPEVITPGAGLSMQGLALVATGADHLAFPISPALQAGDEVIVNNQGQPRRMQAALLRQMFTAGAGVTIDAGGTISAPGTVGPAGPQGAPGPAGSVSNAAPLSAAQATDRVAVSRNGSDGSVQLSALLASPVMAIPGRTVATSLTSIATRRFDPRDWGALFDGINDDAPAIQSALNAAAAAGGGVVRLPDTQGGSILIGSGLTINGSAVRLEGLAPGAVSDNFSDSVPGGLRLIWGGATGGTMVQVSPVADPVNGRPLTGCGISGVLLDCRSKAATGLAVLSARRSTFEVGVINSTGPGILCDTVNLGEYNDVQDCTFDIAVSNIATNGTCVVLDGTSRGGAWVGNTSINRFRRIRLVYNNGDGLVINNADSNHFEAIIGQHRSGYAAGSQLGNGRGIVLNGPTPGGVGASSNCFEYVSCDIHAFAGSINNQVRWLDVGNGAPTPSVDPTATLYVSTSTLVSSGDTNVGLTVADSVIAAQSARAARGAEALRVQAMSGDHVRFVAADGAVEWGLQAAPGGTLQLQPRKGSGQLVSIGSATLGAGGGLLLSNSSSTPTAPSSGILLYSQSGQLRAVGPAGQITIGGGAALPTGAQLIGSNASGIAQAITLGSSLVLNGSTLDVQQSTPSALTSAAQLNDTDKLPISQGSDDSFDFAATPAQFATYVQGKIVPVSAQILGSTSQGSMQPVTLGNGLSLSANTLSVTGAMSSPYARPSLTALTWVNQGTATAIDHASGPLTIIAPPFKGDSVRGLVTTAPGTPYTHSIVVNLFAPAVGSYSGGLLLQNASTGSLCLFGKLASSAAGSTTLMVAHYTSPNAFQSNVVSLVFSPMSGQISLRVTNDGTNITYLASHQGFDWIQVAQEPLTAAGRPDHVGFFVNPNDSSNLGIASMIGLLDWETLTTSSSSIALANARM